MQANHNPSEEHPLESQAEEYIQYTFDASPIGMILVNSEQKIVMNNQSFRSMFGYADAEISKLVINDLVPVGIRPDHSNYFEQYMRQPVARAMGEGRFLQGVKSNGNSFPVEVALTPIETSSGLHILVSIVDISERIHFEEVLTKTNQALKESNEELKQFAYVASHDLQTPLRSISGFAHFLKEDYGNLLDDKANEYIERIITSCERQRVLINDLLTYSRLENRKSSIQKSDLNQLFDEVKKSISLTIEEKKAQVFREELPVVEGDSSQLYQLLQNLIENGLKYNQQPQPIVSMTATREKENWLFTITDNGIGISLEYHNRIFEIFRRLHTQEEYSGSGIGLAICRKIVQRHHGKIWVESIPGEGSKFHFTLPFSQTNKLLNQEAS
ncbi:MAG: ATP-binding protein [Planctomycetaceae bacterium]